VWEKSTVKIARYERDGQAAYGFVVDGHVIGSSALPGGTAPTVRELIASGALPDLATITAAGPGIPVDSVTLLPPVEAEKILCAGVNFPTHREEASLSTARPDHPVIFTRYPDSLVGAGADLLKPAQLERFDYEGELAVIIGRRAHNVAESEATSYVFGYSCFNDGSARDWQRHSSQWIPGKNFYRSGSIGPWIVTADEAGDLDEAELTTRVNGEVRQQARIKDMIFSVAELIAYISAFTPLNPGDVIAAGTPGGVGLFMTPPQFLSAGDVVEIEIGNLGVLRNAVAVPK
jgi:2-keto-4-pentenoate hydratase/2-oxohepta-3-ene-1,7-dioic acid hydratase in catechol pathway